jgi:cytochrome c oxidase assembly factor CtaG
MDLIKDLWHGDVPLVKTYWLFGVAVGILLNVTFIYIEYQPAAFASAFGQVLVLGLAMFVFIYSAFICVAIWRSANKYQGLQRYAILAKIAVIFGVMGMIKTLLEIFGPAPPA